MRAVALASLLVVLAPSFAAATMPTVRNVGAWAEGIGDITPGVPTNTASGDLLILFCETAGNQSIQDGGNSPPFTLINWAWENDALAGSRVSAWYKVAESSTPGVTVADSGNHQMCQIIGITAGTYGVPGSWITNYDLTRDVDTTSVDIPGVTTVEDDCLFFAAESTTLDGNSTAGCSGGAGADVTNDTERIDDQYAGGNGGGLCVWTGEKATAGTITNFTATTPNSTGGELSFVLCGPSATKRNFVTTSQLEAEGAVGALAGLQ